MSKPSHISISLERSEAQCVVRGGLLALAATLQQAGEPSADSKEQLVMFCQFLERLVEKCAEEA